MPATTLARLRAADAFFDAVPRAEATPEDVGPFVLFRPAAGTTYYARPRAGLKTAVTAADLRGLAARCAELALPLALEWVPEVTPSLDAVARAAGLRIEAHPLLGLLPEDLRIAAPVPGVEVVTLEGPDPRLLSARAVAEVSFGAGGTAPGAGGPAERDAAAAALDEPLRARLLHRNAAGVSTTVVAIDPDDGLLATGSICPAGDAAEVVAVATLPVARRRGLAAAVTTALVRLAADAGQAWVVLSAQDPAVARVYERLGFTRFGTHAAAAPPPG